MTRPWVWLCLGVLSTIWAGAIWGGYELFGVMLSALPTTTYWLADFPLVLSLWESGIRFLGGIEGVVRVLAWILWALGQVVLLVLAWVALRFVTGQTLHSIRNRLSQQHYHQRW